MSQEYQPAIDALKKVLAEQERKIIETKNTINALCVHAGIEPLYQNTQAASGQTIGSIKADTFYGKSVITAAREYLDMRKVANLGPASARDVYEALKKGGFAFDSTVETNSITVVRGAMRKQTAIFHRLPNGDYGLTKWYEKIKNKKSKNDDAEIESADPQDEESADE
ncbi:MAG: hypothetical protein WCD70_13275 [Alphaproteobacteria bacterium]